MQVLWRKGGDKQRESEYGHRVRESKHKDASDSGRPARD